MPTARGPVRRDEAFVVYPHQGFMVAVGTASLLIGVACLIAAIVILSSDPSGSAGATGIGSFFCFSAWYVFAARRCPQITVSERGVLLHRDDPITRMLRRTRLTELRWADIRSVDAETRVRASTRSLVWGDCDLLRAHRRRPQEACGRLHKCFHETAACRDEAIRRDGWPSDRMARRRVT